MELLRALGAILDSTGPEQARLAAAVGLPAPAGPVPHTELFRLQLPPYASIYLGTEGMLGGEARDRIAGFWRAMGAPPPPEPDHLTTLLAAHASLVERDAAAGGETPWRAARHAFFWEHLASWTVPYLARVTELGDGFQRAWAEVLTDALTEESRTLGPPVDRPAALAAAPAVDPPAGGDLLDQVLVPVVSGLLLARGDLEGAAARLGLGLRQGERRFALRWLARQDPAGVLGWLAEEAARQSDLWHPASPGLDAVSEHWRSRARSTARVLHRAIDLVPLSLQEAPHA
jgi:hypothetical protein